MSKLLTLARRLDDFSEWIGTAVAWLALLLTAVVAYDVVARYLFHAGSVALQEAEWHIFAVMFLLAAAYTYKHDAHVRVDVVYGKLGLRGKAAVNLFGALLLLIPFSLMIIHASAGFVEMSWNLGEGSGDPGGLPARYILKGMIPAGFSLLILQGIAEIAKSLYELSTGRPVHVAEESDHV